MKLLILSDIHGNLTALEAVLEKVNELQNIEGLVLLGDIIDYGMGSNEVINKLKSISIPVLCNIWGNHEYAICNREFMRFSSLRAVESAKNTLKSLEEYSINYLENEMMREGICEFTVGGRKCLAVHGSYMDPYWKSIYPDTQEINAEYAGYDFVFSGHSHIPLYHSAYYPVENAVTRNKKKTIFLNPGSVGQPRNLNSSAQFLLVDCNTEEIHFGTVPYDIKKEQEKFTNKVNSFYKDRLMWGV